MRKYTPTNIDKDIHKKAVDICDASNQKLYGYINSAVDAKNKEEEKLSRLPSSNIIDKEKIETLLKTLIKNRTSNYVFISTKLKLPEVFSNLMFKIIRTDDINGVVCFGEGYPFSYLDMNIDDIITGDDLIEQYRKKAHRFYADDKDGIIYQHLFKAMNPTKIESDTKQST